MQKLLEKVYESNRENTVIDIPLEPEYVSIYMIGQKREILGATRIPLRECREVRTETGKMVGWYVAPLKCAVIQNGILVAILSVLPDGQQLVVPVSDLGIKAGRVQIGQLMEIEDLRLLHPQATAVVVGSA